MGSDAPTKMAEATIRFSSSIPGPMKTMLKKYTSGYQYEWNGPIAFVRKVNSNIDEESKRDYHPTSNRTLPSLKKKTIDGDNYDGINENDSSNEDSFSSFLSSSIGDNISKSFDWALETTTMQTCQNPFESFCFPLNFPDSSDVSKPARQQREQSEENEDGEEVPQIPVVDSEKDIDGKREEEHRPYVPFCLPLACEYCGSPSIQKCHEFDADCRRPKTFFPKARPPFGRCTERPMPYQ